MFAPITRSMTLTFGLCSVALSPDVLAEPDPDNPPAAIVLAATSVTADSLGSTTENTGFYTCLLYTSPSPRDGLLSRMPSSA